VLADVPVPFPEQYILGIDTQKVDFEKKLRSYLGGEWKEDGWWYFYLYAMCVKVPVGTWILFFLAVGVTVLKPAASAGWRDEITLLAPALATFLLVSSQTGFTHHLKYVLPAFPLLFVWMSKVAHPEALVSRGLRVAVVVALAWAVGSSLWVYPHSLSYFNEPAGGPDRGHEYLHSSNMDWGQDLYYLKRWQDRHPEAQPMRLAYYGPMDPNAAGIEFAPAPPWPPAAELADRGGPQPGWFAVSTNFLIGHRHPMYDGLGTRVAIPDPSFEYFKRFRPVAKAGYSIWIYHISLEEANAVRAEYGLPPLPPK
jgi:hypothetical protein